MLINSQIYIIFISSSFEEYIFQHVYQCMNDKHINVANKN
jgi:hypothetical protein